jgi:hypothetical protein
VSAEDQMDDGTPVRLSVTVDRRDGSATFDFGGTGPEVYGNTNAPPAVAYSAVIYALRCMVSADVPLNQVRFVCRGLLLGFVGVERQRRPLTLRPPPRIAAHDASPLACHRVFSYKSNPSPL